MPSAVDGELRLTYTELDQRVNRLIFALQKKGLQQGDRLLWLGQNSVKLIELLFAVAKIGAMVCPANWRMSVDEIRVTVDDFDPKFIFWQENETGEVHRTSRLGWSEGRFWIQHDGTEHDCFNALLETGEDIDEELLIDPELPLLAIYTAAFSGRPGAAMLSHTALLLQAMLSARGQAIDEHTRYLMSGPMFHIGVLMGGFATFLSGGCSILVSRPNPEELVRLIHEERPTHGFIPHPLVPEMAKVVAKNNYDISSLFAKSDLSDWLAPIVMPPHAPQRVCRGGYGQTEIGGLSVLAWLGGQGAGRPNMFTQVKLLDDAGHEVPNGVTGEIAVRGPMVMSGYWNRENENAARTEHGWHRTRDLGRREQDGSIVFIGPKTTMIKSGIENIYPAEVEACIREHKAIADVCVIGVPDPKWDQNVKAVVVLKPNSSLTVSELADHCRHRMASYKKPKLMDIVEALPKTSAGLVDRTAVDQFHGGGGYPHVG
jgi:long-chain acyl-CoA synthetase